MSCVRGRRYWSPVWKVRKAEQNQKIEAALAQVPATYIADGHHRAAPAMEGGLKNAVRRTTDYTGTEPFNSTSFGPVPGRPADDHAS